MDYRLCKGPELLRIMQMLFSKHGLLRQNWEMKGILFLIALILPTYTLNLTENSNQDASSGANGG